MILTKPADYTAIIMSMRKCSSAINSEIGHSYSILCLAYPACIVLFCANNTASKSITLSCIILLYKKISDGVVAKSTNDKLYIIKYIIQFFVKIVR